MSWSWQFLDRAGEPFDDAATAAGFLTRADAETWLGENWRELAEDGVRAVTLEEDGRQVYGPMSLEPED